MSCLYFESKWKIANNPKRIEKVTGSQNDREFWVGLERDKSNDNDNSNGNGKSKCGAQLQSHAPLVRFAKAPVPPLLQTQADGFAAEQDDGVSTLQSAQ